MKIRTSRTILGCIALSASALSASADVLLDFETSTQLDDNFRAINVSGGTAVQSTLSANGFLKHDRTVVTSAGAIYLYDTTPGDTTLGTQSTFSTSGPLTASFDLYAGPSFSSFAIIFADASNLENNVTALFGVDSSGATGDVLRFHRDGAVNSSWTAGTQVGSTTTAETTVNAMGGSAAFVAGNSFSATLSVSGGTPSISLTAGGHTAPLQSFATGDVDWTNTVVMLRLFDNGAGSGTGVGIDNFAITSAAIPEPSAAALAAGLLAACTGLLRRRRRT